MNALEILGSFARAAVYEIAQAISDTPFTEEGQLIINQTKEAWEAKKPLITSGFQKLQMVAGLNIAFTILYAFYSRKFSLWNLASIYGCIEFSRACSTLKKYLVKDKALYLNVGKNRLENKEDKLTLTHKQNEFLTILKTELIRNSWIMSVMNP